MSGGRTPVAAAGSPAPTFREPEAIAALRLRIQGLTAPRFGDPAETVGWLGAMQAQEYAYAKWSIGKRAPGVDEVAVDRALASGSILRTHVLRPTWHYVRRQDIRWMQRATAHRVRGVLASYDRALELDERLHARTHDLIAQALEGGRHLTRAEISNLLAAAGIEAKGQRLAHLIMRAELDSLVCSGAPRGKQTTYALVAERAAGALELDREEALAELTRRYFTSHGPATAKDFRWWSSLTAREATQGLELVSSELERWTVEERTYWWVPRDPPPTFDAAGAHLLQAYDEVIVGYTESRGVLDIARLDTGNAGRPLYYHPILVGGQFTGRWRRQLRKGGMRLQIQLHRPLSRTEKRAVEDAVERYARFSGLTAEVDW